jgi:hypothetical protein
MLIHLILSRRFTQPWPDFLALLILIGFGAIILASPNREARFAFPAIIALPFLFAVLISGQGQAVPRPSATVAAVLVLCSLVAAAVPMRYRLNGESLARSNAVLAQAARCNAKRIILATDSPTLNWNAINLAITVLGLEDSVEISSLPYDNHDNELPVQEGYPTIRKFDQIAFQHTDLLKLNPRYNQRVSEYETYISHAGYPRVKVYDDVDVYSLRCSLSTQSPN